MVLRKDELEASLREEKQLIQTGKLKEDSPLDRSEVFRALCDAVRRGDLQRIQETLADGANVNACDEYDATPLILASLCGHYEVVEFLLESGALCERDTFQGERCLYNALNSRIRNLLLRYDYAKRTDPLQPFSSHLSSLLSRKEPRTWDLTVTSSDHVFHLHKFLLAARSPFFHDKLRQAPQTTSWKLPTSIPPQSFAVAIQYIYQAEIPVDVGGGPGTGFTEDQVLECIDKISKQLGIQRLWNIILESSNPRMARQHRAEAVAIGRDQMEEWFQANVLQYKLEVDTSSADKIQWSRDNQIFADVLLRADSTAEDVPLSHEAGGPEKDERALRVGPLAFADGDSTLDTKSMSSTAAQRSVLFPAHRAMLLRSEYFAAMFSSAFAEAKDSPHLHIIHVDCTPETLEIVLNYLYTEKSDIPLEHALDVLFTADMLFIERLKTRAATTISTLGSGALTGPEMANGASTSADGEKNTSTTLHTEPVDPYAVLRAAWLLHVPRLEEFAARFFAQRLEHYIDQPEFAELVAESAARIQQRQETDSIELIDDIRYYLSERFRLRFEGNGIEDLLETDGTAVPDSTFSDGLDKISEQHQQAANGTESAEKSPQQQQQQEKEEEDESGKATTAHTNGDIVGDIRTLDGELVTDEFDSDSVNYRVLLDKIEQLLDRLQLDG